MNCPKDKPLCGTLTIESGYVPSRWNTGVPKVHGLWPEIGRYGNSLCCRGDQGCGSSYEPGINTCDVDGQIKWSGCDPAWGGCNEGGCSSTQNKIIGTDAASCDQLSNKHSPCWFPAHEWYKHGVCAGFTNSKDYTTSMVNMSKGPMDVMGRASNWENEKRDICASEWGAYVFEFDERNKQIQFSSCAKPSPHGNASWDLCALDSNTTCKNFTL